VRRWRGDRKSNGMRHRSRCDRASRLGMGAWGPNKGLNQLVASLPLVSPSVRQPRETQDQPREG
jgi:hypothetical protein